MSMTLDEAIKYAEEVAEKNEKKASWFWGKEGNPNYENCVKCAEEHRQLAEWLKELKQLREDRDRLLNALNEIRAEIEQTAKDYDKFDDYRRVRGLWIALDIIDKYKESEE